MTFSFIDRTLLIDYRFFVSMIITYIRSILILSMAILITLLSSNAIILPTQPFETLGNDELCFSQENNNQNDSLPDLLELEEEEELVVHDKRMGLIKCASERVLSIIQFGYHIDKIKNSNGEIKSPPPRC